MGPRSASTILLFHIIRAGPSKQTHMVGSTLGVYNCGLVFVSARTNKRHHHQNNEFSSLDEYSPNLHNKETTRVPDFHTVH